MKNTINSDLIRGNINTIILKALYEGDRYGFDIVKEIEQKSSGQYVIKQPTLYSCLKRLEVQGLIRSYWGAKSIGGRRKYYALTDSGRESFLQNQNEWEYSRTVIDKLISDRTVDIENTAPPTQSEEEVLEEVETDSKEDEENEAYKQFYSDVISTDNELLKDEEEKEVEYADPSQVMLSLLEKENDGKSYTDKLKDDDYEPNAQSKPDFSIFGALDNETGNETDNEKSESVNNIHIQNNYYHLQNNVSETENNEYITQPQTNTQPIEHGQEKKDDFLSYNTKLDSDTDEETDILNREYKVVLSKLVDQSTEIKGAEKLSSEPESVTIPLSKEMQQYVDTTNKSELALIPTDSTSLAVGQENKLNEISLAYREIGEHISIRHSSVEVAKEHNEQIYYYANRLRLVQYAILFGIMLVMTAVVFLIANVWLIGSRPDMIFGLDLAVYIVAIVMTLIFPAVAAIMAFRGPDKQRRIVYSFKNSILFRIVLMLGVLVITYLLNIYFGMEATMGNALIYLPSLLLPALFSLCLPINTLIYQGLLANGRYSVKS